jgi:hypothetical protein
MKNIELLGELSDVALPEELRFFREHEREWSAEHGGKFVVIGRGRFAGFHKSYNDAFQSGFRAFGPLAPFLVKRVRRHFKQE